MEKVQLGKEGPLVTELCFGTLPMGPLQTNISIDKGAEVIKYAINNGGINFLDTAHVYRTYGHIKEAVKNINRGNFILASKTKASSYQEVQTEVKEDLELLKLDYFDIFHIHAAREENPFEVRAEALNALVDLKQEGLIRNIGIATHYVKVVKEAALRDEVDIIFAIINKEGMGIVDGDAKDMLSALKKAKSNDKGIYAMKTLAGGRLINEVESSINFIRKKEFIDVLAIGMVDKKEVDFNIALFNNDEKRVKELTNEMKVKNYKKLRIMSHLCTKCGNCVEECPNFALHLGKNSSEVDHSKCILCGYCTRVCPELAIRIA